MASNWFQKELERVKSEPEYHVFNLLMDFTEGIQKAMDEQGLNRNQLAKKLGVNRAWITRVFQLKENMCLTTIAKMCLALGLKPRMTFEKGVGK